MISRLINILGPAIIASISIIWITHIVYEYIYFHPNYIINIISFKYWYTLLYSFIYILLFTFIRSKINFRSCKIHSLKVYGIDVLLGAILCSISHFIAFGIHQHIFSDISIFEAIIKLLMHVFPLFGALLLFSISSIVIGCKSLFIINHQISDRIRYQLWFASGIALITCVIFTLGAFSMLSFKPIIWAIFIVPCIIYYKITLRAVRTLFFKPLVVRELSLLSLIPSTTIIAVLGLLVLRVLRPIPIGFDDSTYYLNIANLININGSLIDGGNPYNGQLILSIGFLLFGDVKYAIGINLLLSIWALVAVALFARRFLSQDSTIWFFAILLSLPSFLHQMGMEVKVDMPLMLYLIVGLELFLTWSEKESCYLQENLLTETYSNNLIFLVVMGLLSGFALGIKYTVVIYVFGILTLIWFRYFSILGALWILGTCILMIIIAGLTKFTAYRLDALSIYALISIGIILIIGSKFLYFKTNKKYSYRFVLRFLIAVCVFLSAVCCSFSPWVIKHYNEGRILSYQTLLFGKDEFPSIKWNQIHAMFNQSGPTQEMEPEQSDKVNDRVRADSSKLSIETSRFYGSNQHGISLLTIPYDVIMNLNVRQSISEIGYILLFLPIIIGAWLCSRKKFVLAAVIIGGEVILGIISTATAVSEKLCGTISDYECSMDAIAVYSSTPKYHSLGITGTVTQFFVPIITKLGAAPFYLEISVITILCIAIVVLVCLSVECYDLKLLSLFCTVYLYFWLLLGNGVYWYGMIGFVLLLLLFWKLLEHRVHSHCFLITSFYAKMFIGVWLFLAFIAAFTPLRGTSYIILPGFDDYILGKIGKDSLVAYINPAYPSAINAINGEPNSLIYRIGTSLPYFIDNNNKRIYNDNEAIYFSRIYNKSKSNSEVAQKLYAAGFRFIVADTALENIDATGKQIMKSRFDAFNDFIKDNPYLDLISNDRIIIADDGNIVFKQGRRRIRLKASQEEGGRVTRKPHNFIFRINNNF